MTGDQNPRDPQTEPPQAPTDETNPWRKETLTVGVTQEATAQREFLLLVEQALDFWAENSETFAGYDISFRFRPNADDPDITVVLVDEIPECGDHTGEYAGCASVDHSQRPPGRVRILSGYGRGHTLEILKHEFGHVLGLGHGDEPADVMSDDIEDRIPDYSDRIEILELYTDSFEHIREGSSHASTLTEHFVNGEYADAETEAVRAHDEYEEAASLIDEAAGIAGDIDERRAAEICQQAYRNVEYRRGAMEEATSMAREADRGNQTAAEQHRENSNAYIEQSREHEISNSQELADALGIPVRDA